MDMSEAGATRKRFVRKVQASQEALSDALRDTNDHGCQRNGPRHKRELKVLRKHMGPMLFADMKMDDGSTALHYFSMSPHGRLKASSMYLHRKYGVQHEASDIELSVHFVDRLFQYYRVRDITRLPKIMKLIGVSCLFQDGGPNQEVVVGDDDGSIGGIIQIRDNVAVTWIGERSLSPGKLKFLAREFAQREVA